MEAGGLLGPPSSLCVSAMVVFAASCSGCVRGVGTGVGS